MAARIPLGAQRWAVRWRKDVLGRNRNVFVIRKSGVACGDGRYINKRDVRADERNGRRRAAMPEARTLIALRGCRRLCGRAVTGVRGRRLDRVRSVSGAGVRELRPGRNGNEPDTHDQGENATQQRSTHGTQDRHSLTSCHYVDPSRELHVPCSLRSRRSDV